MTQPTRPKRDSLYAARSSAGALLGQQLAARGYSNCILPGITPEGVQITSNSARARGAPVDVLVAEFIKLGANLEPVGWIEEQRPSQEDPDFQPNPNHLGDR